MEIKTKFDVYHSEIEVTCPHYSTETWSTTKSQENRLEVNEMRMLRWMCGVTKNDKIRNEHVRGSVKVASVAKKMTEKRLK